MEVNIVAIREKVYTKLNFLKCEMIKFFNCNENDLEIYNINFTNEHFSASISYRHSNKEKSDLRKIITSTYYFDIEGEYIEREGLWYEGVYYLYENLSPFFNVISDEIKGMNK